MERQCPREGGHPGGGGLRPLLQPDRLPDRRRLRQLRPRLRRLRRPAAAQAQGPQGHCLLRDLLQRREAVRVGRGRQERHHLEEHGRGHPQVLAQRLDPGPLLQPGDPAAGVGDRDRLRAVVPRPEVGVEAQDLGQGAVLQLDARRAAPGDRAVRRAGDGPRQGRVGEVRDRAGRAGVDAVVQPVGRGERGRGAGGGGVERQPGLLRPQRDPDRQRQAGRVRPLQHPLLLQRRVHGGGGHRQQERALHPRRDAAAAGMRRGVVDLGGGPAPEAELCGGRAQRRDGGHVPARLQHGPRAVPGQVRLEGPDD
mmetsp:Transcript_12147/g.30432  ORF Transcript_12147/g.30432 Transcript_12147/m.30432 type:complete len:310 (+) Transcript_12147:134-1063(+)